MIVMSRALRTLVLTPGMQYHRVLSWAKGVVAVVFDKADVLESYDVVCASPSISLQIPAVIRMRKLRATKKGVRFSRPNVYARDGQRCCYCGVRFVSKDLTFDHVLPRSRGGATDFLNIVTCCKPDNIRKGQRTPAEAGMRMLYQPHAPSSLPMSTPLIMAVDDVEPLWRPYLAAMGHAAVA